MGIFEKWAESLDYQYEIDSAVCVRYKSHLASCQACIEICPVSAIVLHNGKPIIDGKGCYECGKCLTACPVQAVSGIFPTPDIQAGELILDQENLPSVKELLVYYAKGVRILISEVSETRTHVQPILDSVNTYLEMLQKEPIQLRAQATTAKEDLAYSRRALFSFWKEEGKSILQQAAPANWRFNQGDFELAKYNRNFQWYTIDMDMQRCTLCKACTVLCSKRCFRLDKEQIMVLAQACSNCQLCVDACPEHAIQIIEDIKLAKPEVYRVFHKKCNHCGRSFQTVKKQDACCLICSKHQSGYLRSSYV